MSLSRFADWQRLRVQESAGDIPAGSMPRSMDVIVRNEAVDRAKAGDKVEFTGTLVVVPDRSGLARAGEAATGGKGGGRGNAADGGRGYTGLKKLGTQEMTCVPAPLLPLLPPHPPCLPQVPHVLHRVHGPLHRRARRYERGRARGGGRRRRRHPGGRARGDHPDARDPAAVPQARRERGAVHLRPPRGEAGRPPHALRRGAQEDGRGHPAPRRHQRVHRGRPVDGQVAVPQVRARVPPARHLHVRQVGLGRRPHGLGRQGRGDGRVRRRSRRAHAGRQRHLL